MRPSQPTLAWAATLLPALALSCTAAPEPELADTESSVDPAAPAPVVEIGRQTLTLAPGHTVTIQRFSDDALLFTEVGSLGQHEQQLADLPVELPVSAVIASLGGASAEPALTEPIDRTATAAAATAATAEVTTPPPAAPIDAIARGTVTAKAIPRSSDVPIVRPIPVGAADYDVLRCDDKAMTACFPALRGVAGTPWDLGGYYRTLAFHRGSSGTATFTLDTWNGAVVPVSTLVLQPGQWGQMQFLSATQGWAHATIAAPTGAHVGISALSTTIAPRAQEQSWWCWAAAAQMTMAAHGTSLEQCEIANRHWNRTDCCTDPDACNGGGESCQALQENGFAYDGHGRSAVDDPRALAQMLQSGPVVLHQTQHYTVLSDYREFKEGGVWVPYALHTDPWAFQDYHQENHMRWVRLSEVGVGNGGWADSALSNLRPSGRSTFATAAISRVSWLDDVATVYFDAPDAWSFNYRFLESGGATDGAVWASGSVPAIHDWATNASSASFPVGAWLWFSAQVQACNGWICGPWASLRSVSLPPTVALDALTWSGDVLTASVRAEAAPANTVFRYRFVDAGNSRMVPWRVGTVAGTASRYASTATITFGVGAALWTRVQVQACSDNGCSAWVERQIYTGS